ncbi:unnamed protein product [Gadus morhua 'NCC']
MATGRCHQRLTPGPALGLLLLWGNALQMHGGGPATTNVSSVISPRHIPKPLLRPRRRRFYFETPFCSPAPSSSCSPGEHVELPLPSCFPGRQPAVGSDQHRGPLPPPVLRKDTTGSLTEEPQASEPFPTSPSKSTSTPRTTFHPELSENSRTSSDSRSSLSQPQQQQSPAPPVTHGGSGGGGCGDRAALVSGLTCRRCSKEPPSPASLPWSGYSTGLGDSDGPPTYWVPGAWGMSPTLPSSPSLQRLEI